MSTAHEWLLISVDDYLAGELNATVKHEYVAGKVYAMVGARVTHNVIATNVIGILHGSLRGSHCRVYNPDMKVRVQLASGTRFYYPDASVVCDSNPATNTFQDKPVVIVEVISDSTRRIDEHEKVDAYLTIPSLTHYLLVEQDSVGVLVYEREGDTFERRVFTKLTDKIPLPSIGAEIALSELYDGAIPPQA